MSATLPFVIPSAAEGPCRAPFPNASVQANGNRAALPIPVTAAEVNATLPFVTRGTRYSLSSPMVPLGNVFDRADLLFALMEKRNPEAIRPRQIRCARGGYCRSLGFPGFPVDLVGVDGLHAVFSYGKPHTRLCPVQRGRKSGFARDDKGEGGDLIRSRQIGWTEKEPQVPFRVLTGH